VLGSLFKALVALGHESWPANALKQQVAIAVIADSLWHAARNDHGIARAHPDRRPAIDFHHPFAGGNDVPLVNLQAM
jgi:hypothetical protein